MNKERKYYLICWVLLLALFNVICFVTPSEVGGISKYSGAFWPCYGFITAAFIIHLIFMAAIMQKKQNRIRTSMVLVSFIELMLMSAAGGICMAIPFVPAWIGIIACAVILVFSIVFMIATKTAGENAVAANAELNIKTGFMRELIDDAQHLQAKAQTAESKASAKKIYDAIRYSDLTSDEAFAQEERAIMKQISELGVLMDNGATGETIESKTGELLRLIEERNQKCMSNKRTRV